MGTQRDVFYVPWADSSEWNTVKEQMFSGDINDTIKAYKTILMWKLKYHSIPAYIECTYSLLQVMVKEYEMSKSETPVLLSENELQLSYSMALIRFVNHVLSISSYKGLSLYLAAKTQNIPDWIINMRHDVSHGQDLPTLDALHQAAELSLQWLLDYYWANNENSEEKSLHLSQFDMDLGNFEALDIDIKNFFKKVLDLWELCQSENYNKLQNVMEVDREFMLQVDDVFGSYNNYFSNTENEIYTFFKKIISTYNEKEKCEENKSVYKFDEFKMALLKFLKEIVKGNPQLKHVLILSVLETSILLENDFNPFKWQSVLHLLQQTSSFQLFLEILFELAGKGHRGATKWLSVLAPSIKHLKKQWAMFKMINKEKKSSVTKLLKKKIRKAVKPDPNVVITLDISKPPVLTLEIIKSGLLNAENFSLEDIIKYLNLVKPPLMKKTLDLIIEIVSLQKYSKNEMEIIEFDKIYTVEDLSEALVSENNLVFEKSTSSTGWTRTSIGFDAWNKCSLGLLPFQSKVDCSLPKDLKWKKSRLLQKTVSIPLVKHGIAMKKTLQMTLVLREKTTSKKKPYKKEEEDDDDESDEEDDQNFEGDEVKVYETQAARVDKILKICFRISRRDIEDMFYQTKVRVNGKILKKKSANANVGDEIDIINGFVNYSSKLINVHRIEILSIKEDSERLRYSVKVKKSKSLIIQNYSGSDEWRG